MKYSRKMKLVDADNALDDIYLMNRNGNTKKNIYKIDSKINKILNLKNISEEKKAKLYNMELQRYLFFLKQNRKPNELKLVMEEKDNFHKNNQNIDEEKDDKSLFINSQNYESEEEADYSDYEIQDPPSSTPYKEYKISNIHSSNPFLSAQEANLKEDISKNGHINISPVKLKSSMNETNPFKPKNKLDRSAILTRKLVNNSVGAAKKLKGWLSLSKK